MHIFYISQLGLPLARTTYPSSTSWDTKRARKRKNLYLWMVYDTQACGEVTECHRGGHHTCATSTMCALYGLWCFHILHLLKHPLLLQLGQCTLLCHPMLTPHITGKHLAANRDINCQVNGSEDSKPYQFHQFSKSPTSFCSSNSSKKSRMLL